ncbi:MAG: hypothetical protein L0H96_24720 [Humibacillus sp.]|nr:hypothetical protein [Humibacillus sp.]MDN5780087.1 hypothetical protein [Humibacillus sp.]
MNHQRLTAAAMFAVMSMLVPLGLAWAWVQWLSPTVWTTLEAAAANPDEGAGALTTIGLMSIVAWAGVKAARTSRFNRPRVEANQWDLPASPQHRARHEAAHAVTIAAMGGAVVSLDIRRSGNQGGQCLAHLPDAMPAVDSLWAQLVHALAGNAIDLAGGHHDQGAQSDIGCAIQTAAGIISTGHRPAGYDGPLTFDGLLSGARDQAGIILTVYNDQLESIVARLVNRPGARFTTRQLPELEQVHHVLDRGSPTHAAPLTPSAVAHA